MAVPDYLKDIFGRLEKSGPIPAGVLSVFQLAVGLAFGLVSRADYLWLITIAVLISLTITWCGFAIYWYRVRGRPNSNGLLTAPPASDLKPKWLVGARQLGPSDLIFDPDQSRVGEMFRRIDSDEHRIGCLWGPAGVGKSSLLNKGLREICEARGWRVVVVPQPGADPVARCVEIVRSMLPQTGLPAADDATADAFAALLTALTEPRDEGHSRSKCLLIFDQFEQFLIANPDVDVRRRLFRPIADIVGRAAVARPRVLIALRKEFVADLDVLADFSTGISDPNCRVPLSPWRQWNARAFLAKIVESGEAEFAGQLIDEIASDINRMNLPTADSDAAQLSTGVLPIQLQLVAGVLRERHVRNVQEYRAIGGARETLRSVIRDTVAPAGTDPGAERVNVGNHLLRVLCERDQKSGGRLVLSATELTGRVDQRLSDEGKKISRKRLKDHMSVQLDRLQSRTLVIRPTAEGYCLAHDYLETVIRDVTPGLESAKKRAADLVLAIRSHAIGRPPVLLPRAGADLIRRYATDAKRDREVRSSLLLTRFVHVGLVVVAIIAATVAITLLLPFGSAIELESAVDLNEPRNWSIDSAHRILSVITGVGDAPSRAEVWRLDGIAPRAPIFTVPAESAIVSPDGGHVAILTSGKLHLLSTDGPPPSPLPMALADLNVSLEPAKKPDDSQPTTDEVQQSDSPGSLFSKLKFSADGQWLLFISGERKAYLLRTDAPAVMREVGQFVEAEADELSLAAVEYDAGEDGTGLAARKSALFAICVAGRMLLVAPERSPLAVEHALEGSRLLDCSFLARGRFLSIQYGNGAISIWPIKDRDAETPFVLAFPQPDKVDEANPEQIDFVATRNGRHLYGRSRHAPYAGWDLSQGGPSAPLQPLFTPAPRADDRALGTWASSDSKWIAGIAADSGLYIWSVADATPRKVQYRVSDLARFGLEEAPAVSFGTRGDEALVSNGRGALLTVMLDQAMSTSTVSRIGRRGYRLLALKDGTGWLASSSAEIQLVWSDGTKLSSAPVLDLIAWSERNADGGYLIAGTDSRMLRFHHVFKLWGFSVKDFGWPAVEVDLSSPAASRKSEGGDGGGGD